MSLNLCSTFGMSNCCPFTPMMNEAGLNVGTLLSVAGFILGAYLVNPYALRMWPVLMAAGSIYLGRLALDTSKTRGFQTDGKTNITSQADWITAGGLEVTIGKFMPWYGIIRNTTLGNLLGPIVYQVASIFVGGYLPGGLLKPFPYNALVAGTVTACLLDIAVNAYLTYSSGKTNLYPWSIYQMTGLMSGTWVPIIPGTASGTWNSSTCKVNS